jgi:outer membrane protein OmpA-like peptidoglycan-associated protein
MLDSFRELASPAILSILTRQTNESESAVSRAFSAAIPAIGATIANRSEDSGFMKELTDLATRTAADPDPLKTITRLATSGGTGIDTTTPTGSFLSSLFGHNLSGMVDSISNYAGIRGTSAASILSACAPLVLGYLGRMMRSDNLTTAGLADRLRAHRNQLASAVPLGFEMPEFFHTPYRAARAAADDSVRHVQAREADASWTVPVLALIGLLGLGGLIWWASHKPVIETSRVEQTQPMTPYRTPLPATPAPDTSREVGTTGMTPAIGTTGTVPGGRVTRTLPGNVIITIPSGGAADRLYNYVTSSATGGRVITLDMVKFTNGSAMLSPDSREQVDNVAAILKAYPKTNVTVEGYTDNQGNEHSNMALSKARAEAVAGRIIAKGVSSDRVHSEGYGSQKAMGDNTTDEGRAENRRVTLEVK